MKYSEMKTKSCNVGSCSRVDEATPKGCPTYGAAFFIPLLRTVKCRHLYQTNPLSARASPMHRVRGLR